MFRVISLLLLFLLSAPSFAASRVYKYSGFTGSSPEAALQSYFSSQGLAGISCSSGSCVLLTASSGCASGFFKRSYVFSSIVETQDGVVASTGATYGSWRAVGSYTADCSTASVTPSSVVYSGTWNESASSSSSSSSSSSCPSAGTASNIAYYANECVASSYCLNGCEVSTGAPGGGYIYGPWSNGYLYKNVSTYSGQSCSGTGYIGPQTVAVCGGSSSSASSAASSKASSSAGSSSGSSSSSASSAASSSSGASSSKAGQSSSGATSSDGNACVGAGCSGSNSSSGAASSASGTNSSSASSGSGTGCASSAGTSSGSASSCGSGTDSGKFDQDGADAELKAAKDKLSSRFNEIVSAMRGAFGSVSGGGGILPCKSAVILGREFRLCPSDYREQLDVLPALVMLIAAVISAFIIFR